MANHSSGYGGPSAYEDHQDYRRQTLQQADEVLHGHGQSTAQGAISVENAVGFRLNPGFPNPTSYEIIHIKDPMIARELSRIFAMTPPEAVAVAADYPLRVYGISPYDVPASPIVARRGHITAAKLLSQRPSYVKAMVVHSRGGYNQRPCERCSAAYDGVGEFNHYAGCISMYSFFGNACSNCIHDDYGNRCTNKFDGDDMELPYDDYKRRYGKQGDPTIKSVVKHAGPVYDPFKITERQRRGY